jgi:hypothetical protein
MSLRVNCLLDDDICLCILLDQHTELHFYNAIFTENNSSQVALLAKLRCQNVFTT